MAWDRLRQVLFGRSPAAPADPIEPPDQQQIEMIAAMGQRMVDVVNESMRIAHDSKKIETRRSRIRVARERVAKLQELAADYPFLKIGRLADVERDLEKIDRETDRLETDEEGNDGWLDNFFARMDDMTRESAEKDLASIIDHSIQTAGASESVQTRRSNTALARQKLEKLQKILADRAVPDTAYLVNMDRELSAIERETARLAAEYETSVPARSDAFLRFPLRKQCDALNIPLEVLKIDRREGQWIVAGSAHQRPENAAMAHYQAQGWAGTACEGSAVLMLMKAACLDYLAKVNTFGSREDACMRFFEAQCIIHREQSTAIIGEIERAGKATVLANLAEIMSQPRYSVIYPAMDAEALISTWQAITPTQLASFAGSIFDDPSYRAGWPDLTLARGKAVMFVEVKTTDKLHASQRDVILGILQPSGADVRVLRLKPT